MRTECGVQILKEEIEIHQYIKELTEIQDDSFYIINLGTLERKFREWTSNLPTVTPFYAVKCNDSLTVIKTLAALGCGFDCASKGEIKKALSIGVPVEKIIFANPAKSECHLKFAADNGVQMMTYDNYHEIDKVKKYCPKAMLVLRIKADALDSSVPLGPKFGCEPDNGIELMEAAVKKGLNVMGISFHVGSGCKELAAYARAIRLACNLIAQAKKRNILISLLDIGGGFNGDDSLQFSQITILINEALNDEKETLKGINIIAEPGRYFASSAFTLIASINGLKYEDNLIQYYINNGIYGSFNAVITEHTLKIPIPFKKTRQGPLKKSRIWGQTNRPLDLVLPNCLLPEMKAGEWLVFSEMGAYSIPLTLNFNGFTNPKEYSIVNEDTWYQLSSYFHKTDGNHEEDKLAKAKNIHI